MSQPTHTLHCWTRTEYDRMVETGVFRPDTRLELLAGEIIEMSPQKNPHAAAVSLVAEALRGGLEKGFHVRGQMPLSLDDYSEPEPDVALVEGNIRDYADHHPSTAVLVVEVADTTLAYDRLHKAAAYARNAIPEYWILNLRDRCLAVWRSGPPQAGPGHLRRAYSAHRRRDHLSPGDTGAAGRNRGLAALNPEEFEPQRPAGRDPSTPFHQILQ